MYWDRYLDGFLTACDVPDDLRGERARAPRERARGRGALVAHRARLATRACARSTRPACGSASSRTPTAPSNSSCASTKSRRSAPGPASRSSASSTRPSVGVAKPDPRIFEHRARRDGRGRGRRVVRRRHARPSTSSVRGTRACGRSSSIRSSCTSTATSTGWGPSRSSRRSSGPDSRPAALGSVLTTVRTEEHGDVARTAIRAMRDAPRSRPARPAHSGRASGCAGSRRPRRSAPRSSAAAPPGRRGPRCTGCRWSVAPATRSRGVCPTSP